MSVAVEVIDLYKNYHSGKSKFAGIGHYEINSNSVSNKNATNIQGLNFQVNSGEIFGIIGPDGAGKTTLFRILTTLILPDGGEAKVEGFDVVKDYKEIRKRIGYMPGRFSLYQDLTVEENLNFFATVFNTTIKENYELIKEIYQHIEPFKKRVAGKLSGGMKQKLALSCALIHKPSVLFLDEPTTGVDPVSRKEFWGMLKNLQQQGITILVSTPYMDEAALCDRIGLMQNGQLLAIETPNEIQSRYSQSLWAIKSTHMYSLLNDIRSFNQVESCYTFGDSHHVSLKETFHSIKELEHYLRTKGHQPLQVEMIAPSIEDCFLSLSQKPNKER